MCSLYSFTSAVSARAIICKCHHLQVPPSASATICKCHHLQVPPSARATICKCHHLQVPPSACATVRMCRPKFGQLPTIMRLHASTVQSHDWCAYLGFWDFVMQSQIRSQSSTHAPLSFSFLDLLMSLGFKVSLDFWIVESSLQIRNVSSLSSAVQGWTTTSGPVLTSTLQ